MKNILFPAQKKYLESYRKQEDKLILEMEEFAEQHSIPILEWHAIEFIEKLIQISKPKRVLEIGTAIGYSTIRIARCLAKSASIFTIEKSGDNVELASKYINKSGESRKIKLIYGDALSVLPQMDKKFDFIFLDADKHDYKRLFDFSMLLLKKGGIIIVDNVLWHGYTASSNVPAKYKTSTRHIRDFNKIFILQQNLDSMILPVGDGLGFGIKK
ncbi:MAG: O-methyltransferase [Ignavibacterium sp.]|nr:O-methyltransferase [Ignavibacterium sp.]